MAICLQAKKNCITDRVEEKRNTNRDSFLRSSSGHAIVRNMKYRLPIRCYCYHARIFCSFTFIYFDTHM